MKNRICWLSLGGAVLLLIPCWALSQDPPRYKERPPPEPVRRSPTESPRLPASTSPPPTLLGTPVKTGDPTNPSDKMRQALEADRVTPGAAPSRMPVVTLAGRVLARDRAPAALIEVDGRRVAVTKGSTLRIQGDLTLQILEVSALEVRVEILPLKEVILLQ